jgi:hypothetical protein
LANNCLRRFDSLSPQNRLQLREFLLTWLRDPSHVQGLPAYLLNKIAHVLALIFKREYITQWQSFFSDLLSLLENGPSMADLVLRVCTTIHEEIVAREINRCVTIRLESQTKGQARNISLLGCSARRAHAFHGICAKRKSTSGRARFALPYS